MSERKRREKWRFEKRFRNIKRRIIMKELRLLEKELQLLEAEYYCKVAEYNMLAQNFARDVLRLRRLRYVV